MARGQTILRPGLIGPTIVDHDLVRRVLEIKRLGITESFHTVDRKGRSVTVTRKSSADLYSRIMSARGMPVLVGAGR